MTRAFVTGTAILIFAGAAQTSALAQTVAMAPAGFHEFKTLSLRPDERLRLQLEEEQERRLGTAGPPAKTVVGPQFDITHALVGALQYHWTAGQKPELGWRGVPVRAKIKTNGVYFGFSYRP